MKQLIRNVLVLGVVLSSHFACQSGGMGAGVGVFIVGTLIAYPIVWLLGDEQPDDTDNQAP